MGSGFVANRTTDSSPLNKIKNASAKVRKSGTTRGQKSRKSPHDSKIKNHIQSWRMTGQSVSNSEGKNYFASVEDLGKATPLVVFKTEGLPSFGPSRTIESSTMEMRDTEIGDITLVQVNAGVEERSHESNKMKVDQDPTRVPLKKISNCPFVDDEKGGFSVATDCDCISRDPLKNVDPSLWPKNISSAGDDCPQGHANLLADGLGSLVDVEDDMQCEVEGNNSVPS